jgi:transposase-like protein
MELTYDSIGANMLKMWKPWSRVRLCPRCGSFEVYRHRGRGLFTRLVLGLVLVRRYSCRNCNSLYFGYLLSRRKAGDTEVTD